MSRPEGWTDGDGTFARTSALTRTGKAMTERARIGAMALVIAVAVTGCNTGDITDVNENPNAPEQVQPRFLLSAIVQEGVDAVLGDPSLSLEWGNPWTQHYAALQYGYDDRYEMPADFSDGHWDLFWLDPLPDAQTMVELGREEGRPNVEAVGLILKSWLFHVVTDTWGAVPYSEALQPGQSIAPTYDSQEAIYDGIIADLKAAQDMIDPSGSLFEGQGPTYDIIFQGDMERWRRFANSLRLRAGMRLSEVDAGTARSVVQSAVADGVIETPSDEPALRFPGQFPNEAPWSAYFRERLNDYRASATMVDSLKALNDPRLEIYFDPAPEDGEYRGKPNGTVDTHGIPYATLSDIGTYWKQPDLPSWIITLEEVLFFRAEAVARGWIGGDAGTLYEDAIRASMEKHGVPTADIDAYLAQAEVQYDPARWREQIGLQKWIALFQNGMEAWAEYRRLGVPALQPGPAAVEPTIPLRVPYPAHEEDLNNQNLQAARSSQGGDDATVPLWWDVD